MIIRFNRKRWTRYVQSNGSTADFTVNPFITFKDWSELWIRFYGHQFNIIVWEFCSWGFRILSFQKYEGGKCRSLFSLWKHDEVDLCTQKEDPIKYTINVFFKEFHIKRR